MWKQHSRKKKLNFNKLKVCQTQLCKKLPITKRPKIYTEIYPSSKNQLKYAKTAKLNFTKQVDKLNVTKQVDKLNFTKQVDKLNKTCGPSISTSIVTPFIQGNSQSAMQLFLCLLTSVSWESFPYWTLTRTCPNFVSLLPPLLNLPTTPSQQQPSTDPNFIFLLPPHLLLNPPPPQKGELPK